MRMSLVCVALFASCARPQVAEPAPLPLAAIALPSVISRTPLGRDATGVSIDAQGQRFVWIRGVGLHQVTSEGLVLREVVDGVTVDDVRAATEPELVVDLVRVGS